MLNRYVSHKTTHNPKHTEPKGINFQARATTSAREPKFIRVVTNYYFQIHMIGMKLQLINVYQLNKNPRATSFICSLRALKVYWTG